jgi:solute carrier family 25 carnitine/acylcarnitine transporter 20/29
MTSATEVVKDLFCGCVSGWGQVFTMLPFENIKLKVVSKPEEYGQGYLHAFKKTIAEEGFLSFYKGMLMPLLGVGAQVSLQFGTVETIKKIIKVNFSEPDGSLHWKYSVLSGVLSGIPSAFVVVTPSPDVDCPRPLPIQSGAAQIKRSRLRANCREHLPAVWPA